MTTQPGPKLSLASLAEELGMELIAEARQLSAVALEKHRAGRQIIAAAREHHETRRERAS